MEYCMETCLPFYTCIDPVWFYFQFLCAVVNLAEIGRMCLAIWIRTPYYGSISAASVSVSFISVYDRVAPRCWLKEQTKQHLRGEQECIIQLCLTIVAHRMLSERTIKYMQRLSGERKRIIHIRIVTAAHIMLCGRTIECSIPAARTRVPSISVWWWRRT